MAKVLNQVSHTFGEYLLIPGLTTEECTPENINLRTPLVKFHRGEESRIQLNIPFVSAIMQSVSNDTLAIELARNGGLSFIFGSQPIESQAEMVRKVKKFKAGFVTSDSNLTPDQTLQDVLDLTHLTGHSTIAITEDGTPNGKLLGIVTSRDYRLSTTPRETKIASFMTPFAKLTVGRLGITLSEANDIIWEHKLNTLPIIDERQNLQFFVFRKDYDSHRENPCELSDKVNKQLLVGAGINTRDYKERVPALVEAGVDVVCIDSSDGYSVWQQQTLQWVKQHYPELPIGAGNVVEKDGFRYLVEAGADFVKVGIGGGSICITREQKGIGRGQASAVMDIAEARDQYFEETGVYIPICSDGGIVHDYHMTLALAMGADFLMMGRYFARFDESPTKKLKVNNNYVKEYWGEGSNRAKNWQRYDSGSETEGMKFEEGVDSYVPYAGKMKDNLMLTLGKMKATMCSCGAVDIKALHRSSQVTLVSSTSIVEGGAHDVILKE
ncbi:IMP dehydrogenase [uncultured Porphyromonas sp.]|uniref:IMP dehydrogenase n=1 Tax=uncultured Porphyromonas sp. TaxID=159274 RepID=UPI002623F52C|nr:IMP dehydrogenase [uncultured Porphyromonas sp.]